MIKVKKAKGQSGLLPNMAKAKAKAAQKKNKANINSFQLANGTMLDTETMELATEEDDDDDFDMVDKHVDVDLLQILSYTSS
jgi:hypothetical protein